MSDLAGQIVDSMQAQVEATPAAPAVDGASATPTPVVNKDEKLSSRIEILLKRERTAMDLEKSAKAKEAEVEAKLARFKDFDSAKTNPKKALELLGMDYDELTKALLNDGQITPEQQIKRVEEKLEQFTKSREADEERKVTEAKQAAEAQEQKVIAGFKTELNAYIDENAERYEFIKFEGQQELVFEVIDEHYNRTIDPATGIGKVMTKAEAADKVEAFLEKKEVDRKQLKKAQTLWGAPKGILQDVAKQAVTPQKSMTLTNQLSATTTKPRTTPVTDEERVQRAIAYARSLRA